MREALIAWMTRRGWDAAAAACRECTTQRQLAQQAATQAQQQQQHTPAPPAAVAQSGVCSAPCAPAMATGGPLQVPAEAPVPTAIDRIAVRT